jgi:O-antigen/teichoic acid export membrane protein
VPLGAPGSASDPWPVLRGHAASSVEAVRSSARGRYALAAFAGHTLFAVVAFAGSVLTARLFGPARRGELTAWFLAATLASLVLAGPLPVGMGRAFLAGERRKLILAPWVHAVGAAVAATIAAVVAVAAGAGPVTAALLLVVAVPAGVVVNDLLVVFQAAKRPWSYHATRLPAPVALVVGLAALWSLGRTSLTAAYAVIAVGSVVSAVAGSVLARLRLPPLDPAARSTAVAKQLSQFWRLGRGSYVAVLLDAVLLRADQFVILIAGRAELGLYVVAVNCSEIGLYLGHAIGQAAFEEETTLDRSQARRMLGRSASSVAAISTVIAVGGFFLIPDVFGGAFRDARYALLLLAPGVVARTVAYTGGQIMLAQGSARAVSRISAVTTAAALPVWALAAWRFGLYGISAASTLVYGLQMALIVRCFGTAARLRQP